MLLAWPGLWLRSFGFLRCSDFLKTLLRSKEMLLSAEVFLLSLISSLYLMIVGTLENGYVHNVPLPRIPRIQSTSQVATALTSRESNVTRHSWITWIPTWSELSCSTEGFGTIPSSLFPSRWLV